MDFTNRSTQPVNSNSSVANSMNKKHREQEPNKLSRFGFVMGVFSIVVILVAVILVVSVSNNNNSYNENKYVYNNKLQAVFLNTGQVYFGNIKALNSKYFVLDNIYYLQTSGSSTATTSSSSSNVSLVKLGCELHQPYDQMVINTSEITFWENLQSTGQVARAVASFEKANPDGQKCSDQSASASTTSGSATQSAGASDSSTNP
jgi:uncharacterized membrane protein